ncbi:unnamed protein product [Bursaphelenchus okinawaensis]|uniref:Transthyretin-like family protein n=1 Tax=Bursaphelenchus okinawaensis TaxID=465554 RepID=A0A811K9T6_9BILA|nr:unnamed protein product [Bursaphelenchus okinawaensis]CAG9094238.1 unnamed protein product [Bursaphelenchus okinawaensis]
MQSTGVRGNLQCDNNPASGVMIRLYDEDRTDLDDLMKEGLTDKDGTFQLLGHETEITKIDPKINIYHTCGHTGPCKRKLTIYIPDNYISEGETPGKIFDIGRLNLNARFSGESNDCIH